MSVRARISRRTLIASPLLAWPALAARAAPAPARLALWPEGPPGGGGPQGELALDARGAVSNIAQPFLDVFLPERPNGAAVLVAGGGGYKRIEIGYEARPAAAWLQARGVAAFVLGYRLPREGWGDGPAAPLQDAQRALRLIRFHAARFQLDPRRVGALGFSAGGHLLGMASARAGAAVYASRDAVDALAATSAATALVYPVITLEPPYDATSTRKSLVGEHPVPGAAAEWSVQTHVHADCAPMFLAQAEDDPIADAHNTLIMAAACERAGVAVEMHRFASGGHGFAMGRPGTPTLAWPGFYEAWLRRRGFVA